MSVADYQCYLSKRAMDFWKRQSAKERRRLDDFFIWLEQHLHHEGGGCEIDQRGMPVFQSICSRFVVSHRTDHAVREVRVQDIAAD